MKLITILLFAACIQVSAKTNGQSITLSLKDAPLAKVFKEIQKQSGYAFVYFNDDLASTKKVDIEVKSLDLEEVLKTCLKDQPLSFSITDKIVIIKKSPVTATEVLQGFFPPPPIDVRGRIVNEIGEGVVATVTVKGTKIATSTNENGFFVLKGVDDNAVLVITASNIETREILVHGKADLVTISVKIRISPLDEVIIKPYSTNTKRNELGNSVHIAAAQIEKAPVQNPLLAIQGLAPGIEITQQTGMNGGAVKIRIQGQNSIRSNALEPLIVVDGVPYPPQLSSVGLENIVRGGSPLNYINPNDIESIDILKDADATAIYGSRAANGAILITTKKGKAGKTRLSVNLQQGWGQVTRRVNMMNTRQYLDMRYEAFANDGRIPSSNPSAAAPFLYAPDLTIWDTTRYTDWQKELIGGTSKYTNLNATFSGGTAAAQYLISATYRKQTTVFPGDFDDKVAGLHFNVGGVSPNQKLRVQLSGSYMYDQNHLPGDDLTTKAVLLEPNAPALYKADGTLNWAPNAAGNSTWTNPLAHTVSKDFINTTKNLVSNATFTYNIISGLELSSSLGYNNSQSDIYFPQRLEFFQPEFRATSNRSAQFGKRTMSNWIIEPQLRYGRYISKGRLEGLLGITWQQSSSDALMVTGTGYGSDQLMTSLLAANTKTVNVSTATLFKYNAVFGRLSYNWKDKYLMNLNARRDGSSRFGDKTKFHNFGSVALGWIFSNEKFIEKSLPFLSFGKLRGSYGTTGNDQITEYLYISTYGVTSPSILYQGITGLQVTRLPNPNIQWEETRKWQGGIDLGFIKDRIIVGVTYANNVSDNQLIQYVLPDVTGWPSINQNFPASIRNTSWEFTLNTVNLKSSNFSWATSINLTIPRNKLVSFPGIEETSYATGIDGVIVGQPLGIIKTYRYAGVDPSTGKYSVYDEHGNPTITPSSSTDRTALVYPGIRFYGGILNSISYKGFTLDLLFQIVSQNGFNALYYSNGTSVDGRFSSSASNQPVTVLNRWQKPGDKGPINRFTTNQSGGLAFSTNSDADYSFDASYGRLKNVSMSWQVPNKMIQKAKLQNALLYFRGENLLTITKYSGLDPETQSHTTIPPLQVWTVGIKMDF